MQNAEKNSNIYLILKSLSFQLLSTKACEYHQKIYELIDDHIEKLKKIKFSYENNFKDAIDNEKRGLKDSFNLTTLVLNFNAEYENFIKPAYYNFIQQHLNIIEHLYSQAESNK